jgi:hypothetical protein
LNKNARQLTIFAVMGYRAWVYNSKIQIANIICDTRSLVIHAVVYLFDLGGAQRHNKMASRACLGVSLGQINIKFGYSRF